MTIREQIAANMVAAIRRYESTFEWGGRVIPCVRRDAPTMMELQDAGGFIDAADYWLVVAKAEFPNGVYPSAGDLVNSGKHKIKPTNGNKDPFAAQVVLHCGEVQ